MTKKVAVVILNWNGKKFLQQLLPTLIHHTPSDVDIVVGDNASSDGSVEFLQQQFPQIKIIQNDKNYGFAEGYNRVLSQVDADYFVLLNSDVEVTDNWIYPVVDLMESDKSIAICQPKLLSFYERDTFEYAGGAGGYIDKYGYPFCRGRMFTTLEKNNGQYNDACEIFWATGAAMFVKAEVWKQLGGLDGDFFAHMEEIDLCWRTLLSGRQIYVVPQSHVYHLGGGSLDASNPRKTYLNFRNNLLMLHKNLPRRVGRRTVFWRRILDSIAWCKFVVAFDWKNAVAVLRAHRDFRRMRKKYVDFPSQDLLHTSPSRPNILIDYFLLRRLKWRR